MIKIYSKTSEHILRILSQIPKKRHDSVFIAKDICRAAKVPEHSARKALQLLVNQGILKAVPGPGGGYTMAAHPRTISLWRIISILEREKSYERCIMGMPHCNSKQPCAMHGEWMDLRERMIKGFEKKTLFDVMKNN